MANIIEAFVAFDTSKLRNAVAIAEAAAVAFRGLRHCQVSPLSLLGPLDLTPRSF
jgi:hypothetical protein